MGGGANVAGALLAYKLLPLLSIAGCLAMMFASQASAAVRPDLLGIGGVMLIVAFGGLSMAMAMQVVRAHASEPTTDVAKRKRPAARLAFVVSPVRGKPTSRSP